MGIKPLPFQVLYFFNCNRGLRLLLALLCMAGIWSASQDVRAQSATVESLSLIPTTSLSFEQQAVAQPVDIEIRVYLLTNAAAGTILDPTDFNTRTDVRSALNSGIEVTATILDDSLTSLTPATQAVDFLLFTDAASDPNNRGPSALVQLTAEVRPGFDGRFMLAFSLPQILGGSAVLNLTAVYDVHAVPLVEKIEYSVEPAYPGRRAGEAAGVPIFEFVTAETALRLEALLFVSEGSAPQPADGYPLVLDLNAPTLASAALNTTEFRVVEVGGRITAVTTLTASIEDIGFLGRHSIAVNLQLGTAYLAAGADAPEALALNLHRIPEHQLTISMSPPPNYGRRELSTFNVQQATVTARDHLGLAVTPRAGIILQVRSDNFVTPVINTFPLTFSGGEATVGSIVFNQSQSEPATLQNIVGRDILALDSTRNYNINNQMATLTFELSVPPGFVGNTVQLSREVVELLSYSAEIVDTEETMVALVVGADGGRTFLIQPPNNTVDVRLPLLIEAAGEGALELEPLSMRLTVNVRSLLAAGAALQVIPQALQNADSLPGSIVRSTPLDDLADGRTEHALTLLSDGVISSTRVTGVDDRSGSTRVLATSRQWRAVELLIPATRNLQRAEFELSFVEEISGRVSTMGVVFAPQATAVLTSVTVTAAQTEYTVARRDEKVDIPLLVSAIYSDPDLVDESLEVTLNVRVNGADLGLNRVVTLINGMPEQTTLTVTLGEVDNLNITVHPQISGAADRVVGQFFVTLVEEFERLEIAAESEIREVFPGSGVSIAVTVRGYGSVGNLFQPPVPVVFDYSVDSGSYNSVQVLSFTGGIAEETVSVALPNFGVDSKVTLRARAGTLVSTSVVMILPGMADVDSIRIVPETPTEAVLDFRTQGVLVSGDNNSAEFRLRLEPNIAASAVTSTNHALISLSNIFFHPLTPEIAGQAVTALSSNGSVMILPSAGVAVQPGVGDCTACTAIVEFVDGAPIILNVRLDLGDLVASRRVEALVTVPDYSIGQPQQQSTVRLGLQTPNPQQLQRSLLTGASISFTQERVDVDFEVIDAVALSLQVRYFDIEDREWWRHSDLLTLSFSNSFFGGGGSVFSALTIGPVNSNTGFAVDPAGEVIFARVRNSAGEVIHMAAQCADTASNTVGGEQLCEVNENAAGQLVLSTMPSRYFAANAIVNFSHITNINNRSLREADRQLVSLRPVNFNLNFIPDHNSVELEVDVLQARLVDGQWLLRQTLEVSSEYSYTFIYSDTNQLPPPVIPFPGQTTATSARSSNESLSPFAGHYFEYTADIPYTAESDSVAFALRQRLTAARVIVQSAQTVAVQGGQSARYQLLLVPEISRGELPMTPATLELSFRAYDTRSVSAVFSAGDGDISSLGGSIRLTISDDSTLTVTVELTAPAVFVNSTAVTVVAARTDHILTDLTTDLSAAMPELAISPLVGELSTVTVTAAASSLEFVAGTPVPAAVTVSLDYLGAASATEDLLVTVTPSTDAITVAGAGAVQFVNGAAVTVPLMLTTGLVDEASVEVAVSGGGDAAVIPAIIQLSRVELLTSLSVDAPATVSQNGVGNRLQIPVTVTALGASGRPARQADVAALALRLSRVPGGETAATQALAFDNGVAMATVSVALLQQEQDEELLLTLNGIPGGVVSPMPTTISLVADIEIPQLTTVTVTAEHLQYTVATAVQDAEIALTVTPEYAGAVADSESLSLTYEASDPRVGVVIVPQNLVIANGAAVQSTMRVRLNGAEQATVIVGVEGAGDAAVVSATLTVTLVEQLATLTIEIPTTASQAVAGAAVEFVATVRAQGTLDNPFDPGGAILRVMSATAERTYALSFVAGVATVPVAFPLSQQGISEPLTLSVNSGLIGDTAQLHLRALPLLIGISVAVAPAELIVRSREQVVNPVVEVSLIYAGEIGTANNLMLVSTAEATNSGNVVINGSHQLNFVAGVPASSVLSLQLGDGNDRASVVFDVVGTAAIGVPVSTAGLTVTLVEQVAELAIDVPDSVMQAVAGSGFEFVATVISTGTTGVRFDPRGASLQVAALGNTSAPVSYPLTFSGGVATVTVTAELLAQGINGGLSLAVTADGITASERIELAALPVLTGVSVSADAASYAVATREQTVTAVVNIELTYVGAAAASENLTLTVAEASGNGIFSASQALDFVAGQSQQTTVTFALGTADELNITLGVDGAAGATVTTAGLTVVLVEQLARFEIMAPSRVAQTTAGAAFEFPVTVRAFGTVGRPVNPEIIVLNLNSLNNIEAGSSYPLVFSDGMATVMVSAGLDMQGIDGQLLLTATTANADISTSQQVALTALPALTAVTITLDSTERTVATYDEQVTPVIEVALTYAGAAIADSESLSLTVTEVDAAGMVRSSRSLPLRFSRGQPQQTTVTVQLGDGNEELTLRFGISGVAETVDINGARLQVTLVPELGSLDVQTGGFQQRRQPAPGAPFTLTAKVLAFDTLGRPLTPPGLTLEVRSLENIDLRGMSSYPLTFNSENFAKKIFDVNLIEQGMAARIQMSVASGGVSDTEEFSLTPLPVLQSIVVSVDNSTFNVMSRDEEVEVGVEVQLNYAGVLPSSNVALTLTPSVAGGLVSPSQVLNFSRGATAAATTVQISLNSVDDLTVILGVEATTVQVTLAFGADPIAIVGIDEFDQLVTPASVRLSLEQQLSTLTITAPATATQLSADGDIVFTVMVEAFGTAGGGIEPDNAVLEVIPVDNALASTYALSFSAGVSSVPVSIGLENQGFNGEVMLRVAVGDIADEQTVQLLARPVIATATVMVEQASYTVARRDQRVSIPVTVMLEYLGVAGDTGTVMLAVAVSTSGIAASGELSLDFAGGTTAQTTLSVELGRADEVTLELGVAGETALVENTARVTLTLVEELDRFEINAPASIAQPAFEEQVEFAVTVRALGSVGSLFNPSGLSLQVSSVANATTAAYALDFVDGSAQTTVTVSLLQQGLDGAVELSVDSGTVSAVHPLLLTAAPLPPEPVLSTVSITVERSAYTVARRDQQVVVTVAVRLEYADIIPDSRVLNLRITSSADGAVVSDDRLLSFTGGATYTTVTVFIALGSEDQVSVVIDIDAGDAAVSTSEVTVTLVEELAILQIVAENTVIQSATGQPFDFAVAVNAIGSAGGRIGLEELILEVASVLNVDVALSTYVLSFENGMAQTTVTVSLAEQGVDGAVELRTSVAEISAAQSVLLQAERLPAGPGEAVLSTVTVTAEQLQYTVSRRDQRIEVTLAVALQYLDTIADSQFLILEPRPSTTGVVVSANQLLSFVDGATTLTVVASIELGTKDEVTVTFDIGRAATATVVVAEVTVSLVEVLAELQIDVDNSLTQPALGEPFSFPVTVNAIGSAGGTVPPPAGLILEVSAIDNATESTYALSFSDGAAITTVTASLVQPGVNGVLSLQVRADAIRAVETVLLVAAELPSEAVPELSTVNVVVERSMYTVSTREQQVTFAVEVELQYIDTVADFQLLELVPRVSATSVTNVVVSGIQRLNFIDGATTASVMVSVALGSNNDRVTLTLDVLRAGTAEVQLAEVTVLLVEELRELQIEAPQSLTQAAADADFEFEVAVMAQGSLGGGFDPDGLLLQVVSAANVTTSYMLDFRGGIATATVTASLLQQGSNTASSLLVVASAEIVATGQVELLALPVLNSVSLSVERSEFTVNSLQQRVSLELTVILDYVDVVAENTTLELVLTPEDAPVMLLAGQTLNFADSSTRLTTTIELQLTDVVGAEIELGVSGTDAVVQTARVSLSVVNEFDSATLSAPTTAEQQSNGAVLSFVTTVFADGTAGSFDPTGLILQVVPLRNSTVDSSTYALSFSAGISTVQVTVALQQQGINGEVGLELLDADGMLLDDDSVQLLALPVLSTVTITAVAESNTVTSRDQAVEVMVTVTPAYIDNIAPANNLTLSLSADEPSAILSSSELLLNLVGAQPLATNFSITLGSTERVTVTLDVADAVAGLSVETAAVTVTLVEELAALQLVSPSQVTQEVSGEALRFPINVYATGSAGSRLDPEGLILDVISVANASESTYLLSFRAGAAQTTVTVSLLEQQLNGEVILRVRSPVSVAEQVVFLLHAVVDDVPVPSTVTVAVAAEEFVVDELNQRLAVEITVALEYEEAIADEQLLILVVETSTNGAVVEFEPLLRFTDAATVLTTTVFVQLTEISELMLTLSVDGVGEATVLGTAFGVSLAEPELQSVAVTVDGESDVVLDFWQFDRREVNTSLPAELVPEVLRQQFELLLNANYIEGSVVAESRVIVTLENIVATPLLSSFSADTGRGTEQLQTTVLPQDSANAVILPGPGIEIMAGTSSRRATVTLMRGQSLRLGVQLDLGDVRAIRRLEARVAVLADDGRQLMAEPVVLAAQIPTPDQLQQSLLGSADVVVLSSSYNPLLSPVADIHFEVLFNNSNGDHIDDLETRLEFRNSSGRTQSVLTAVAQAGENAAAIISAARETILTRVLDDTGQVTEIAAQCAVDNGIGSSASMCVVEAGADGQWVLSSIRSQYFAPAAITEFVYDRFLPGQIVGLSTSNQVVAARDTNFTLHFIPGASATNLELTLVQRRSVGDRVLLSQPGQALMASNRFEYTFLNFSADTLPYPGLTVEAEQKIENSSYLAFHLFQNQTTLNYVARSASMRFSMVSSLERLVMRVVEPASMSIGASASADFTVTVKPQISAAVGTFEPRSLSIEFDSLPIGVASAEIVGVNGVDVAPVAPYILQISDDSTLTLAVRLNSNNQITTTAAATVRIMPVQGAEQVDLSEASAQLEVFPRTGVLRAVSVTAAQQLVFVSGSETTATVGLRIGLEYIDSIAAFDDLELVAIPSAEGAEVSLERQQLSFINGGAILTTVNISLGTLTALDLMISVTGADAGAEVLPATVRVELKGVLSTVTITAAENNRVVPTSEAPTSVGLTIALDYVDVVSASEMLQLLAVSSPTGAIVSFEGAEILRFTDGTALRTTVNISLGGLASAEIMISAASGDGTADFNIVPAVINVSLVEPTDTTLNTVFLRLLSAEPLQQTAVGDPVVFAVRIGGRNAAGEALPIEQLALQVVSSELSTFTVMAPERVPANDAEFSIMVELSDGVDTTVAVSIGGLPSYVTVMPAVLLVPVLAAELPGAGPLDINGDGEVDPGDLVRIIRLLDNPFGFGGAGGQSGEENSANLPDAPAPVNSLLRFLQMAQGSDSDSLDFNNDDRVTQLDIRILLRYMAGLRGSALGSNVDIDKIERQLGN